MKTITYFLTLAFILFFVHVHAQSESAYEKAMKVNIAALNEAKTAEGLQTVINKFERINQKEQKEWLPKYYIGLAYIYKAMRATDAAQKDALLAESQKYLDQLQAVSPENSEVLALQGFNLLMYVSVDPANRGASHTPKTMEALQRALAIDKNNPRASLLMGQMQYGVAQFFGSGTEEACLLIQRASQLLENSPEDTIQPHWGKESAKAYVQVCQEGQAKKGK